MKRITLISVLFVLACGGGGGADTPPDSTGGEGVVDDLKPAEVVQDSGEDAGEDCPENWVLEFFAIEEGMSFETEKTITVQVRIYDSLLAVAVVGQKVSFSMEGGGDAKLGQAEAATNDQGIASVELDTGTMEGVEYTVTASNVCAGSVSLGLHSIAPEQGAIFATFTVSEELSLMWGELSIEAYANNTIPLCGAVDFTSPPGTPIKLPDGQMSVEFANALARSAYLVFGLARNADGLAVGAGCQEGVVVMPEQTTEVEVTLVPLSLDPTGKFDMTLQADLAGVLQPIWIDAGAALNDVVMNSPTTIGDSIMEHLETVLPEGIPDCGEEDVEEAVRNSVEAGLAGYPPDDIGWLGDQADGFLQEMLSNVVFQGTLMVEEGAETGRFNAEWAYEKIVFEGDLPCFDQGCADSLEFSMDEFGLGDVALVLDKELFELQADGFDGLVIPEFQPQIVPGKVMLFAFVNVMLPAVGASNKMTELFDSMYDCGQLLSKVSPQVTVCINNPAALSDGCNLGVAGLKTLFYEQVAVMTGEQSIWFAGAAASTDEDGDLVADSLEGELGGEYENAGNSVAAFTFPFSAER